MMNCPGRMAFLPVLAAASAALVLLGIAGPGTPARAATTHTIVSLTFDDSDEDQYTNALPALESHGMHGTFYAITGYVGVNSGYLTVPQLQAMYNAGNEIGGHTVLHPNLTQVSNAEATREICDSRDTLLGWGFPVTDFAYPYSAYNSTTETILKQCGYNSGREDGDITSPYGCVSGCPLAETIPPADPYGIRAPQSIQDNWTLPQIEGLVTQAEDNGGGWSVLVFHHICDNACDAYSVTPENFNALLTWLQTQNVSVETVAQVIGGPVQPAVTAPTVPPAPPGSNGVTNPSLETADPNNPGTPYCWQTTTGAGDTASFAETSAAHTGSVAETVTMSSYTGGDAALISTHDLGQCAPSVVAGDAYLVSAWYQSSTPTRFVFWYRDANGAWHSWTQSPQYGAASSWTQANWVTPAVPAGATALSFGLSIAAVGTLTTDDYSLMDSGGPPTPPTVSLTGPAAGATLSGTVTFTATASSAVGIAQVSFLVDGVVVATSTTSPYTATWNSATVGDGPVTVTAQATDAAGNKATTAGQAGTVSNAAGRGGNLLANGTLQANTGGGSTPDCWHESSTGTNTPAWSYTTSGPNGGNAENVTISSYTSGSAQLVSTQNASACSPRVTPGGTYTLGAWYESNQPTHILAYYQNSSGSWVYWTESPAFAASAAGAQAAWTTPAVPSGATALSFGLSLAAAGSLTTTNYTMTAGAPAAPTVSLTGPAAGATLSGTVTFTATASSPVGISKVSFLVDGVVVATASSSPYTATWDSTTVGDGPVTVTAQATDAAGNKTTSAGQAGTVSNAAGRGGNLLANAGLETNTGGGSTPNCWQEGDTGTNSPAWTYTASAHSGSHAENVAISSYTSGSAQLVSAQGTSACSPRVTPGSAYTLGAWYQSTQPTHIVAYYQNSSGSWVYWTESPAFAASSAWAQAAWTTPAVPSGATALSFGLDLGAAGSLTTDDYTMTAGAPGGSGQHRPFAARSGHN
jgi:peptidoglycan/xylan/chitin deacetylase (PgdA/CDA1 family)/archaellum component FlaF (FlaF/FlaG flagellin family)